MVAKAEPLFGNKDEKALECAVVGVEKQLGQGRQLGSPVPPAAPREKKRPSPSRDNDGAWVTWGKMECAPKPDAYPSLQ